MTDQTAPTKRDTPKSEPVTPGLHPAKVVVDLDVVRADLGALQATVASDLQKLAESIDIIKRDVLVLRGRTDGLDAGTVDHRTRLENVANNVQAALGKIDAKVNALGPTPAS